MPPTHLEKVEPIRVGEEKGREESEGDGAWGRCCKREEGIGVDDGIGSSMIGTAPSLGCYNPSK